MQILILHSPFANFNCSIVGATKQTALVLLASCKKRAKLSFNFSSSSAKQLTATDERSFLFAEEFATYSTCNTDTKSRALELAFRVTQQLSCVEWAVDLLLLYCCVSVCLRSCTATFIRLLRLANRFSAQLNKQQKNNKWSAKTLLSAFELCLFVVELHFWALLCCRVYVVFEANFWPNIAWVLHHLFYFYEHLILAKGMLKTSLANQFLAAKWF